MVLSRVILNLANRAARRDLANPYEMHSTLMRMVDAGSNRMLWRVEQESGQMQTAIMLVQTEVEPKSDAVLSQSADYFLRFDSKRNLLLDRVGEEAILNFRLRANPTVTRDGKRHGLERTEEQLAWLERQIARAGCELIGAQASQVIKLRIARRQQTKPIVILGVTFDGQLRVLDGHVLRGSVINGIGPGKALGLGLLTLAR